MMNLYRRAFTFMLIGAIFLLALAATAAAAPPVLPAQQDATATPPAAIPPAPAAASVCDELQVIFIADQSGSMAGYTDATGQYFPPTDPINMRFDGLKAGVATLIGVHPAYQDVRFKAAIINFGDTVQTLMDWTDLNPMTTAEADAQMAQLAPLFNPTLPLGNTLPGLGIQEASVFFEKGGVRPQVDGCPRRVVILLTDGLPYDDVPGFNWQTHMASTAAYARQFLPSPNYSLYVIGLDQNGAFFDESLDEWAAVTGDPDRVLLAANPGQMGAYIAQILADALANTGDINITRGCADNGQIVVPPYKQQLRIMLFKTTDPNLHLEVQDPGGRRLDDSLADVTITGQAGAVETLVVSNPQPGVWRVLTQLPAGTADQCLVNFIAIPAVEQVLEPADGIHVPRFTTVPITFQLVDEAGNALPDYGEDRYSLQMNVELRYGSGPKELLSLSANPGQQYRGQAAAYYEGPAEVFVNATALDDQRVEYTIFDKAIASFVVDPVSFVAVELPAAGRRIGQHTPLPISFAVVDSAGQPVAIDVVPAVELNLTGS